MVCPKRFRIELDFDAAEEDTAVKDPAEGMKDQLRHALGLPDSKRKGDKPRGKIVGWIHFSGVTKVLKSRFIHSAH